MCNNDALGPKKMAKVLPIYDLLNVTMKKFGILYKNLSVDESMVPYFGRHSCKRFIRGKQIRFGFKLWVISSSTGVPYHVSIYEGKEDGADNEPLGSRVVKQAVDACKLSNPHVICDNFFTSCNLIRDLADKGLSATGTIRKNRVDNCPLPSVEEMKKMDSGSYANKSDGKVELVRWNDNNVVTLCSNALGVYPLGKAKRWKKGKYINVDQPAVIKHYNDCMGGVDLVDRALSDLRPVIQGKKWYWALFVNAINLMFVYSWRIYEIAVGKKVQQKQFRDEIVGVLLQVPSEKPSKDSRSGPGLSIPTPVRYDGKGHYPQDCPVRKCVMCRKSARIQCKKCEKTLHLSICF